MKSRYPENWPQFFTATIYEWKVLLKPDSFKRIIIDCLKYLSDHKKVRVYGYVIMQNHIHLIWQAEGGSHLKDIQFTKRGSLFFMLPTKELHEIYFGKVLKVAECRSVEGI